MRNGNTVNVDRRTYLKLTGMAGGTVALAGCTGGADDPADLDEITVTLSQFPDTIDPLDHITGDYFDVLDHIYEPLFDFEPGDGIFPRVVEETEIIEGEGITELTLQEGVVFHNGDEMTAEDVAWTINRTVDPTIGVPSPIGTFGLGSITARKPSTRQPSR